MGLSKNIRLKSASDISDLYKTGESFRKYPVRVLYHIVPQEQSGINYAVTAPKRNFKKAVSRNKLKRLLRELVRLNHQDLHKLTMKKSLSLQILVIYYGREIEDFAKIRESFLRCFNQLKEVVETYEN